MRSDSSMRQTSSIHRRVHRARREVDGINLSPIISALSAVNFSTLVRARALIFLTVVAGCGAAGLFARREFDGRQAMRYVEAQMAFGPRVPNTGGHRRAGDWIRDQLAALADSVEVQEFTHVTAQGDTLRLRNFIGRFRPEIRDRVLFLAHWDTRPRAERSPNLADQRRPVPGANDGASGVAVLLELARVLPETGLNRPLWLAFFDLEDGGGAAGGDWIQGSRAFAAGLPSMPAAAIIVDMIGDADLQIHYEMNSDPILRESIWATATSLGFESFIAMPRHSMLDDHIPFLELGIPSVLIIDFNYPYYHTTQDTLDKVSAESLEQVGQTLEAWLLSRP